MGMTQVVIGLCVKTLPGLLESNSINHICLPFCLLIMSESVKANCILLQEQQKSLAMKNNQYGFENEYTEHEIDRDIMCSLFCFVMFRYVLFCIFFSNIP